MKHKLQALAIGLGILALSVLGLIGVTFVVVMLMVHVSYWAPVVIILGAMTLLIAYSLGDEFLRTKGRKNGK